MTPAHSVRPIVGREAELERLRRLLADAIAGERRVVFIAGEAGAGKTTLVESFLDRAAGASSFLLGRGQCLEQRGAGEPYMPVLEALGRLCREPGGEEIVALLTSRAPTWLAQMPWLLQPEELEALQSRIVGATRERMLREMLETLDELTRDRPLVLVLEDLHWSDPSTIDLLSALARRDDPARLVLVATYRPQEARAGSHPVWEAAQELEQRGLASEIPLQALTPRAVADYLELRFPRSGLPLELSEHLHDRTGGNPLFLEKVVDSWVESGSIAAVDGVFVLQATVAELSVDIPGTVRQLIEHQLDELDGGDQELVEAAAAAGAEFAAATVAAACGRVEDDVEARLAELARQGRLFEALGESVWPDGTVSSRLGFIHDLYAEVAYARLSPGRRARLHRNIGARLESAFGEGAGEVASELAVHFLRARDPDRTAHYLALVAEQALGRRAPREAIEHLAGAIGALNELPEGRERAERELALTLALGIALIAARGYAAPEVEETYARARDLCRHLGDTGHLFPALYGLWVNAFVSGRHRAAHRLGQEFLELAEASGDPAVVVAHRAVGWPLLSMGRFGDARVHLEEGVARYDRERHRPLGLLYGQDPGAAGGAALAWSLWFLGFPDQASRRSSEAVALARELDQPISSAYTLGLDAMLRQLRRERDVALVQAEAAIKLATEGGITLWRAWASVPLGWALAAAGDHEQGIAAIRDGLDASAATGAAWSRPHFLALLAEAQLGAGDSDGALASLADALAAAEANDERWYEAEIHRLRGEALVSEPTLGQGAEEAFRVALEVARRQEAKGLELRAAVSLGRFLRDRGRSAEARELLSSVYGWFTEGFDTPDLRDAAELLAELGQAPPGRRVVEPVTPARSGRPIVGREAELERLRILWDEARAGERRIVFVSGEAGAGKTTLVESLLGQANGLGDLLLARGQCLEQHGAGEPYMPVLEALGRLCREPGGEEIVALLTSRAPTWLAQMPWLLQPEELQALQSRTLGANRERMLREMLETLDEVARDRLLVLVLEDLHWSDPSTIDLLEAVARRPDRARLLVLGTFRPQRGVARHPLYAVAANLRLRGFATELALGVLPPDAVREFLALRCPGSGFADELASVLHERTRGNPLFLEKVVDSWLEQGSLRQQNGGWVVTSGIETLAVEVPSTLRELIEQRLAEVADEDRQLLEAASVAGTEFSAALVAAACERDADDVDARLADLARHGLFVDARGEEAWPDRTIAGRYAFTHDLCQEVLYDLLPAGRRGRLHDRVGTRLEQGYGDRASEIAPELGSHFVRARDAGRAVRHLFRAAEQALGRSAPREAIEQLSAGLDLVGSLPGDEQKRWELAFQATLGPAQIAAKGWAAPEAEAALLRARELAAALGQNEEESQVLFKLGALYEVRGEYMRSDTLLEESLHLAGTPPAPPAVVDSNELLACSLFHQGAFGRALEHAEVGLSHFDGLYTNALTAAYGDHAGVACQSWAALALWFLGRPEQALQRARQAVTMASDPRNAHGLAFAQAQAAVVSQCRLEPGPARKWAEAAVASGELRGFRYRVAMGRILRGWALAAQGETDAGIDELRGGLELSRATGARMDDPYYLGLLADACARAGRHEEALAALAEALDLVQGSRTYFYEPELHRLRGDVLLGAGQNAGEASLERALEVAQRQGSAALELRSAVSLGRLRRGQGREAEAATIVAAAYEKFTEGFDTPDLTRARVLLAELGAAVPVPRERATLSALARPGVETAGLPVRYARSGNLNIAYQVIGEGPIDLVLVHGWVCSFHPGWENPKIARFYRRLASLGRLVLFDKRGTGLSDRVPSDRLPDLETRMEDVRVVMDAAGSERAVVIGISEGGAMSALFAATHPERAAGLVLLGTFARTMWAPDYPLGSTEDEWQARRVPVDVEDWALERTRAWLERSAPDAARSEEELRWYTSYVARGASPGAELALAWMNKDLDVRHVLPAIRVPTLVVYRSHEWYREATRFMGEHIHGAEVVELPGTDHLPWEGDQDALLDRIAAFVSQREGNPHADPRRVLATILVSDIVGSTETAGRLGDRAWADLLVIHERTVREVLARFAGELLDTAGDGALALFDGPSRAIRAGLALSARLAELDLPVRVGIHTGEIERVGHSARGIAVHLAARVAGEGAPGEVLVTATTRDLVAGSGLSFSDRGERLLKGFDEPRGLFAAEG